MRTLSEAVKFSGWGRFHVPSWGLCSSLTVSEGATYSPHADNIVVPEGEINAFAAVPAVHKSETRLQVEVSVAVSEGENRFQLVASLVGAEDKNRLQLAVNIVVSEGANYLQLVVSIVGTEGANRLQLADILIVAEGEKRSGPEGAKRSRYSTAKENP